MKHWGLFYILVAVLSGYASLTSMMSAVNGSQESNWPVLTFAASILLLVDGVKLYFPRIHSVWLIGLTGASPIAVCVIFGEWPLRCWIFSVVLIGLEALFLSIFRITGRQGSAAFFGCLVLLISFTISSFAIYSHYWQDWWNAKSMLTSTDIVGIMLPSIIPFSILIAILIHSGRHLGQRHKSSRSLSV